MLGFSWPQLAAAAAAAPVGAMLHELTHAGAARLLGASTRLSLARLHVDFEFEPGAPTWKHRVVLLAPGIVGLLVGGLWFAFGPGLGDWWLAALLFWSFYTISFGVEDYSLAAARGDPWWFERLGDRNQVAVTALAITTVGVGLWAAYHVAPEALKPSAYIVGRALHLAGGGVLFIGLWQIEQTSRAGA